MTAQPALKSWRDLLNVHPAANLFPLMSREELVALGKDIVKNGLKQKVTLWAEDETAEPVLLDGRNRLDAIEAVGKKIISLGALCNDSPYRGDPYAYVVSANIHRRHLTAEQRRDLIAALLKAAPEKSNRQIAEQVKVDHKTVGAVRVELEATGEVPQLQKTIGADGKSRKAKPASKQAKPKAVPDDSSTVEDEIEPSQYREAFLLRADDAISFGVYSGPIDAEVISAAEHVVKRWSALFPEAKAANATPDARIAELEAKLAEVTKDRDAWKKVVDKFYQRHLAKIILPRPYEPMVRLMKAGVHPDRGGKAEWFQFFNKIEVVIYDEPPDNGLPKTLNELMARRYAVHAERSEKAKRAAAARKAKQSEAKHP